MGGRVIKNVWEKEPSTNLNSLLKSPTKGFMFPKTTAAKMKVCALSLQLHTVSSLKGQSALG